MYTNNHRIIQRSYDFRKLKVSSTMLSKSSWLCLLMYDLQVFSIFSLKNTLFLSTLLTNKSKHKIFVTKLFTHLEIF
jgi:hypothetical protein